MGQQRITAPKPDATFHAHHGRPVLQQSVRGGGLLCGVTMNILHKPTCNFSIISNEILNDKDLSLKAKGLHAFMLSKPECWEFSLRGLKSQLKEGIQSIQGAMNELIEAGYVRREQTRSERGVMDRCEYTLSHEKMPPPRSDAPCPGKPHAVRPDDSNTIESKTDSSNTEDISCDQQKVPVGDKSPRTTDASKTTRKGKKSYPREVLEHVKSTFEARTGGSLPWGRVGKSLAPLSKKYGIQQLVDGWNEYLESTDLEYLSVESFVRKAGIYIERANPADPISTTDDDFSKLRKGE